MTSNKRNVFFTSDTHFSEETYLYYDLRPFQNIEEMNEKLIENWNQTVQPNDVVFHLGDFGDPEEIHDILGQLKGDITICPSKNDPSFVELINMNFKCVAHELFFQHIEFMFYLSHKDQYINNPAILNIHGDGNYSPKINGNSINVSVKHWDYKPVEINQLIKHYKKERNHAVSSDSLLHG